MNGKMRSVHKKWLTISLFLLPSLLGFTVFLLIPIVVSLYLSFTNYSGGFTLDFIGLDNFYSAIGSRNFHSALWVTVKFVVFSVFLQLLLGFFFAILLNRQTVAHKLYRTVVFLPVVLSQVAISLVFMLILHPQKGPVNSFLISVGLAPQAWLASAGTALATIIGVTVWQSFGYYMVLFLSGLQTINLELFEAASIDGAGGWQKMRHVTIPLLSPTTFFVLIISIINAFKVFDQVFVMTGGQLGGGPAGSTTVLVFDIYRNAFQYFKMGYASAEATILLAFILIITIVQYRGQNRWVNYDRL